MKAVHISVNSPDPNIFTPQFLEALESFVELSLVSNGDTLTDAEKAAILRQADVALCCWGASPLPASLAANSGRLKYVCNVTGTVNARVPLEIVSSDIVVTNWGDAPAFSVAEGAMALLLAVLKDLHQHVSTVAADGWYLDPKETGGTLFEADVGIYGCGVIGRKFVEMLRPFCPVVRVFDPFCTELPQGCIGVDSLNELFAQSRIVAIHAGLSDATRNSVTAELLSLLPRDGVLINTARGGIVDQAALFDELRSGRLRAGLDVLEPDDLPPGHEARHWPNCILSAHQIHDDWPTHGLPPKQFQPLHRVCLDNLNRFVNGEELRFIMDPQRYALST